MMKRAVGMEVDKNLLEEDEKSRRQKGLLSLIGGLGDALGSGQSAGNFYLGRMNPESTAGRTAAKSLGDTMADPIKRQGELYQRFKEKKEAQDVDRESKRRALYDDPASMQTKALRAMALKRGIADADQLTGSQILDFMDPKKQLEAEANMANQIKLRQMDNAADLAKYGREKELRSQEKAQELALKKEADEKDRKTVFGLARTPDDAKKLKEAGEMKEKFDSEIGELIELRKKYGAEVANREAVARAKQLSKSLLLTKKNLENLGVLSQSDRDIVNEIIPDDPLQFNFSQLTGQDPTLTKLQAFQSDTDRDFQGRLKQRLEGAPVSQKAVASGQDEKIQAFSEKNGIDYATAERILRSRGYGK